MGIVIRKALPEDAYDYALCRISCWQSAYKEIIPDDYLSSMITESEKKQLIEKYKNNLSNPGNCEYYCVICSEQMIGFFIIDKRECDIWAIYLIEEFRSRGYGTQILSFAISELRHTTSREISLWVFEANVRARHFYENNGFSFNGTTKRDSKYGAMLAQLQYTLTV